MTQEKKDAIIAEYQDKSVKTTDIRKKFHITHATMTKILDERGGTTPAQKAGAH